MDDDSMPYREFSPNEDDTYTNEGSPSEVQQNDDPHKIFVNLDLKVTIPFVGQSFSESKISPMMGWICAP